LGGKRNPPTPTPKENKVPSTEKDSPMVKTKGVAVARKICVNVSKMQAE